MCGCPFTIVGREITKSFFGVSVNVMCDKSFEECFINGLRCWAFCHAFEVWPAQFVEQAVEARGRLSGIVAVVCDVR